MNLRKITYLILKELHLILHLLYLATDVYDNLPEALR